MTLPLAGRVALVTGASRGIGRAIALVLARAGARVGIAARTADELTGVAGEISAAGGTAHAVTADVSVPADVQHMADEIRLRFGPVDLLVNNAGIAGRAVAQPWEEDREAWWRIIAVNVRGPMLCCHAVLPAMIAAGRGHIFNVNSLAGNRAMPTGSAYGVSKAALFRLTESLAAALRGTGVEIFDVSPGLVRTAMTADVPLFRTLPDDAWTPAERIGEMIVRLAGGGYEELAGRFVHAKDDPDALLTALHAHPSADARRLRLVPAGPDDPILG